ncbi:hypothetical protein SK571_39235 [Lentzea sp. BCCO 10_0798]|uniref:Uncharacterized protein n=1 Tax=Lentzea kristufekii TaxID=3095430 RepID=A0ABU4U4D8_9PSEU|nr:hypothetical protein [Lentzea sp. BCCO 10_0798]MDX8055445.1 hypothetical protein [Lentzea sp. BCCO 10_0798]
MKRKTMGITTALTPRAALTATGTLGGTISSALGLSGAGQLVPRDVVRDTDGIHHLRFDRTAVNRSWAAVNVK